MMKRIHVRLTGLVVQDTTHPDFMDNLKAEIEKLLDEKGCFRRTWVKEISIGKEVQ